MFHCSGSDDHKEDGQVGTFQEMLILQAVGAAAIKGQRSCPITSISVPQLTLILQFTFKHRLISSFNLQGSLNSPKVGSDPPTWLTGSIERQFQPLRIVKQPQSWFRSIKLAFRIEELMIGDPPRIVQQPQSRPRID